jgi:hypothetical protein
MKASYRSAAYLCPEPGYRDYLRSCSLSISDELSQRVELLVRLRRSPGLSFKYQLVLLKSYMRVPLLHTHSRVTDHYIPAVASGLVGCHCGSFPIDGPALDGATHLSSPRNGAGSSQYKQCNDGSRRCSGDIDQTQVQQLKLPCRRSCFACWDPPQSLQLRSSQPRPASSFASASQR